MSHGEAESVTVQMDYFHNILFGGDQVTCACVRGGQEIHKKSVTGCGRLERLV